MKRFGGRRRPFFYRPNWVVAVAATLVVAGCGGEAIDSGDLSGKLSNSLEKSLGVGISSVDCPSDISPDRAQSFRCSVEFSSGGSSTFTLRVEPSRDDSPPVVSFERFSGGDS